MYSRDDGVLMAAPNVEDESAKAEAANGGNLGTVGLLDGPKAGTPAGGAAQKK